MDISRFSAQAKTIAIAVPIGAAASASVALPAMGSALRVVNELAAVVYISVGATAQTATLPSGTPAATCMPVGAGQTVVFSIPTGAIQQISAISAATAGAIEVSVGEGS